eukprot:SAG22_NODE_1356_length_4631_cov_2.105693_4_plen_102_part_00
MCTQSSIAQRQDTLRNNGTCTATFSASTKMPTWAAVGDVLRVLDVSARTRPTWAGGSRTSRTTGWPRTTSSTAPRRLRCRGTRPGWPHAGPPAATASRSTR